MTVTIADLDIQGATEGAAGDIVLTWAASEVDSGDMIVLLGNWYDVGAGGQTTPSGYTQKNTSVYATDNHAFTFHKISDGTETGVTWSFDASFKGNLCAKVVKSTEVAFVLADLEDGTPNEGSATTATTQSLTPSEDIAGMIAALFKNDDGAFDDTPSDSFINGVSDAQSGGGGDHPALYVCDKVITGGGAQSMTDGWITTSDYSALTLAVIEASATLTRDQDGYRFYDDDAAPGSETALAAEDTVVAARDRADPFHLRIQTDVTADAPAEALTVEYKEVSDAATEWRAVPE